MNSGRPSAWACPRPGPGSQVPGAVPASWGSVPANLRAGGDRTGRAGTVVHQRFPPPVPAPSVILDRPDSRGRDDNRRDHRRPPPGAPPGPWGHPQPSTPGDDPTRVAPEAGPPQFCQAVRSVPARFGLGDCPHMARGGGLRSPGPIPSRSSPGRGVRVLDDQRQMCAWVGLPDWVSACWPGGSLTAPADALRPVDGARSMPSLMLAVRRSEALAGRSPGTVTAGHRAWEVVVTRTRLGKTDLEVSRVALGCMSCGDRSRGLHTWTLD
jgi:hypothetical protein